MISGAPLFRGRDNQDQLLHIMRIIGTPSDAQFQKIAKETVRLSCVNALRTLTLLIFIAGTSAETISKICEDAIPANLT